MCGFSKTMYNLYPYKIIKTTNAPALFIEQNDAVVDAPRKLDFSGKYSSHNTQLVRIEKQINCASF